MSCASTGTETVFMGTRDKAMHSHAQCINKKLHIGGGHSKGTVRSRDKGKDKGKEIVKL